MNRFWFFFFMFAAAAAVITFAAAPAMHWWFPGASLSPLGAQIDDLFYLILVITGVTFIGVQSVLGFILWKYGSGKRDHAEFSHGSHTLEVVWSIVPAGVLLFIALYQMDVWARYRVKSLFDPEAVAHPIAEVTARQFEWRIRYPGLDKDGKRKVLQDMPQPDDLYTVNDLHVPTGKPVLIRLRSEDVLHSFFLPKLRVKQDAVPGLVIPVWFQCEKVGEHELVCAELCGWGHYKMRGQLTAEGDDEFMKYLEELSKSQFDDGVPAAPPGEEKAEE